jgi:FkbM family methyltransferase
MNSKGNILFIGANDMTEISSYTNNYQNGIFIEALPDVFIKLRTNLENANEKYKTNYIPVNSLISDQQGKEYTFNIFSNEGQSSSIYESNPSIWKWESVKKISEVKLKSTKIENILKEQNWENLRYDLVLDVQGAELDVLKGFNLDHFKNIDKITTEISTVEFYKNGVLFNDLNRFITNIGFKLNSLPESDHCDVVYTRL